MTDKCYRVQFTAHLHKLTLALKMECQIQVIWKRGQKIAESGKVSLAAGEAKFDKKISISCNMIFNTKTKIFKEKITKFSIILTSEKGTKQAGQIQFDVAQYINERQLVKKDYQQKLTGCPDKNAKLWFTLTGVLKQQMGMDAISQSSYVNTDNPPVENGSMMKKRSDSQNDSQPTQDKNRATEGKNQKIKTLEQQNKRIKQQLKAMQKIKRQNDELRKKIKNQDFKKVNQIKQKIQKQKKEIQKMKSQMRTNKKIEDETTKIEDQIYRCTVKIMKAFNYAAEFGGSKLVGQLQDYCGMLQK